MKTARAALPIALSGWTLASCATDVCACTPTPATATLTGRVIDVSGAPFEHALVAAYSAAAPGCHSADTDFGLTASAEDGRFHLDLSEGSAQDSVCVFTFARPPQGGLGANSDTALVVIDFRFGQPQDSAQVELTLPAQ
jgi:hypothetical protein